MHSTAEGDGGFLEKTSRVEGYGKTDDGEVHLLELNSAAWDVGAFLFSVFNTGMKQVH